ncbi:MAG: sulfatase-like hydrolase/transferase, partial [Phycisphaeraceae bacterium]|nr:sulfatase-like hydrolase/transferase [Phycisphaeraceae bacterium]
NGQPVTPVLDGLVASGEALRVDPAYACIGYTAPSIRQAFWGGFARREKTLLHDLKDAGWYTATVSGQDESWSDIASDSGLVDCDFYEDTRQDDPKHVLGGVRRIHRVLWSFEHFITARPKDRPFFLYMNLQDCHFPYDGASEEIIYHDLPRNPALGRDNADGLWRLYVNQAANVDRG